MRQGRIGTETRPCKARRIKWISFEPVLDPEMVLLKIHGFKRYLDRVAIGKLNYCQPPEPIDWGAFGREAEALCQELGLDYYIKASLRKEMERHG